MDWYVAFPLVFLLTFAGVLAAIVYHRRVVIPANCVGVTPTLVLAPGITDYSSPVVQLYDLSPVVHTIPLVYGAYVVSWRPDPNNIRALIKAGDEEGVLQKVQAILTANPKADLRKHEPQLGVTFIDRPDVEVPPDPSYINPAMELDYITATVKTYQDVLTKEAEFFAHHRDILESDPELQHQTKLFFDDLRARVTKMR